MRAGGWASRRDSAEAMTEEEFDDLRRSAFAIAYRMLGSVSEAEDVMQEGFLRLHRARKGGERIESPRAYLSTVVSRLSLDHLRSARVRRETYVGSVSRPRARSARSWRTASSRPPSRAISRGWRNCWPTTWCSTAMAAARHPPSLVRSTAAAGWRAR